MRIYYRIILAVVLIAGLIFGCQNATQSPDSTDESLGPIFAISSNGDALSDIDIPLAPGTGIVAAG